LAIGDRAFLHFTRLNPGECLEGGMVLYVDDPTLTVAELRAHVAERLREAPALTERLSRPTTSTSRDETVWELDHDLDLDYHVGAEELPAGSGEDGLRAALDRIAARPLDLDRPLWRLWLLHGHTPDRVAILYRLNHIHQDGGALHQALHLLFGPDREPALRNLPTFGPPHARDYTRMAGGLLRGIPRTRQLASWGGPPRGEARHTWAVTELETLRQTARRHGVTVNDVYLAAIAGALRAWSLREWAHGRRPVHATMPINLRTQSECELMSNFTFGVRIALPCADPDPAGRLARVAAETRRAKAGGSVAVVGRLILERTPPDASPRMLAQVAAAGSRTKDVALVASNAGTMRGPYTVAGREVSTLIGMPPLFVGRQHLSVTLFGLGMQACAGFTASASVPRYAELPDLWLAELAALGGAVPVPAGERH
jgi:diacylglycerol O-acyltransferase